MPPERQRPLGPLTIRTSNSGQQTAGHVEVSSSLLCPGIETPSPDCTPGRQRDPRTRASLLSWPPIRAHSLPGSTELCPRIFWGYVQNERRTGTEYLNQPRTFQIQNLVYSMLIFRIFKIVHFSPSEYYCL